MEYREAYTLRREGLSRSLMRAMACAVISSLLCVFAGQSMQAMQSARPSRRARAAGAYQRAERLRAALESHPGQPATQYQRVVRAFQLVYRTDPGYPETPAALAAAAGVYEEMGRQFTSDRYYSKAIEAYQFLAAQYPYGSLAADAAYTVAGIYRADIENPVEARAAYEQFLKEFPRSQRAAAARQEIAKIDRQLARWPTRSSPKPVAARRTAMTGTPAAGGLPEVRGIRHWVGPNYTRVVIRMDGPVTFNAMHLEHPPRLVFDLAGARLSPELARKAFPVENGFLERVRVAQFKPDITRVVLDVPQIEDYSVFSLPDPFRLIIDIHGAPKTLLARNLKPSIGTEQRGTRLHAEIGTHVQTAQATPGYRSVTHGMSGQTASRAESNTAARTEALNSGLFPASRPGAAIRPAGSASRSAAPPTPSGLAARDHQVAQAAEAAPAAGAISPPSLATPRSALSPTLTRALGLKIRRIVIDPGHGGKDTGTIGPTGLEEKNLVLDVALRLRKLIVRRMGCQVIMTRSTDVFIPLEERTAIANEYGADLFISIHANASADPSARGIETYYLNFTSDPAALQLAARENSSSQESVYQLQNLIKKIALSEKIDESRQFAKMVDDQLVNHLDEAGDRQKNRGVKKAPFVVLIGANMPSILAEISFVSNPHDEHMLRKGSFREKIAVGLYDGIVRYANSLGTIRVAQRTASPPARPAQPAQPVQHGAPSF
ncbi:MAG: N-acetylmuramoyl-L-alanine amidase [Terriglobia bacterium]